MPVSYFSLQPTFAQNKMDILRNRRTSDESLCEQHACTDRLYN